MLERVFGTAMWSIEEQKDLLGGNGNIKMRGGQGLKFWLWSQKWRGEDSIQLVLAHESQLLNFQEFDELASKIELYMLIIKLNISKTKEINTQNSALHTHTVTYSLEVIYACCIYKWKYRRMCATAHFFPTVFGGVMLLACNQPWQEDYTMEIIKCHPISPHTFPKLAVEHLPAYHWIVMRNI